MKDIEYVYSLKKYLLIAAGVFVLSLILGLLVSAKNPALSEHYLKAFQESFGWIKTLNPILIMLLIFVNNAFKSLLALLLGLGLGVIPVIFVAGNGIILGMLADVISREHGTLFVLAAILPHGVIELPSVLVSATIGLRLGYAVYLSLKGVRTEIKPELKQGLSFYVRVVLPLLFIAAVIETLATPLIASLFLAK